MTTTITRRPVGRPPLCSAAIARTIADWHTAGDSDRVIADRLNQAGVPTPAGGTHWTRVHVWRLRHTAHLRAEGSQVASVAAAPHPARQPTSPRR
ncbi:MULTISPECIES: recombinase family protein [Gordonia]|uniref:recombinase family protein n=1 Tax=Gordonia sp. SMJS1 TaxID=3039400 RepID=UPI0013201DEE|nr:recombinase family protein [Gordonia sp. SMJS1]QHD88458.1 hypothetical protein GR168_23540 [Gordonia sp. JH63]WGJ88100.1 recombinase family protein [Gordonia sp. SMJS1]